MLVTMELWDKQALAALVAGATLLGADLKAGLFTNTITPGKTLVIADLTEPTYTGYVRQTVVMGPPVRDPINGIVSIGEGLLWQEETTASSEIITGIFYTYGAGPALLGVEVFDNPIGLADLLDAFVTVLQYIQSSENAGLTTIIR